MRTAERRLAASVSHRSHSSVTKMSVYTLELEGGKYYVGYSDDVPRRIAEHWMSRGSYWTRMHPPVRVLEVIPGSKELENATTIALMCKYGWRHVRGGLWCSVEMKSMPIPLARALAQRPPRELPSASGSSYDFNDHIIFVKDGPPWTARVTGPMTLELSSGSRTFTADTEAAAKEAAEQWVRQGGKDTRPKKAH